MLFQIDIEGGGQAADEAGAALKSALAGLGDVSVEPVPSGEGGPTLWPEVIRFLVAHKTEIASSLSLDLLKVLVDFAIKYLRPRPTQRIVIACGRHRLQLPATAAAVKRVEGHVAGAKRGVRREHASERAKKPGRKKS